MSETLNAIIKLFEADGGYRWDQKEREHAFARWRQLSDDDRKFLASLSDQDLDNVCIGEARDAENGDVLRLYRSMWQTLPPAVDKFLTDIWEYME